MSLNHGKQSAAAFAERVRGNQRKLRDNLRRSTTSSSVGQVPPDQSLRAA